MRRSSNFFVIAIVGVLVLALAIQILNKEAFTSPGTMVQLATSHVPTQEDVNYYRNIYPKIVRRDITDMTGGDPGPISVPMPQLWF
jgi:hypothetical protein